MRALEAVAHHEAGHAVAACLLGRPVQQASIVRDDSFLGRVTHRPLPKWFRPDIETNGRVRLLLEDEIVCFLAGPEAERRFRGRWDNRGAEHDRSLAADLASYVGGDEAGTRIFLQWCQHRAASLVEVHWRVV